LDAKILSADNSQHVTHFIGSQERFVDDDDEINMSSDVELFDTKYEYTDREIA
jgi:hypothetical protein